MQAILLTHDAQLGLAQLVHKMYARLWPDHPFVFRIPFADAAGSDAFAYLSAQANCRLIESPRAIEESMAALLDGLAGAEWVFWCIDDRFPIGLDAARAARIAAQLGGLGGTVEEVKLLRWKEPWLAERMVIGDTRFRRQAPGSRARGFWHHHFVRAGVLRAVFLGGEGARDGAIAAVNERIKHREAELFRGTAQVPTKPLLSLGEPLVAGQLTRNGRQWLARMQCDIPPYGAVDRIVEFR